MTTNSNIKVFEQNWSPLKILRVLSVRWSLAIYGSTRRRHMIPIDEIDIDTLHGVVMVELCDGLTSA